MKWIILGLNKKLYCITCFWSFLMSFAVAIFFLPSVKVKTHIIGEIILMTDSKSLNSTLQYLQFQLSFNFWTYPRNCWTRSFGLKSEISLDLNSSSCSLLSLSLRMSSRCFTSLALSTQKLCSPLFFSVLLFIFFKECNRCKLSYFVQLWVCESYSSKYFLPAECSRTKLCIDLTNVLWKHKQM